MRRAFAQYLPGAQFTGGIYFSRLPERVAVFTTAELRHAGRNDTQSRIHVAVMDGPTVWACPAAHRERELFQPMPATRAGFRTGEPFIHGDNHTARPLGLVFQLPTEFSPTSVRNRAGQSRVTNHVFDLEVFNADYIVLAYKPCGQRVQRVAALVSDPTMGARDAQSLLLTALAAFLSAGKAPLLLSQIPKAVSESARVLDLLAAAQGRQVSKAKVNANYRIRHWQQFNLDRGAERDVVAPVRLTLERCSVRASDGWKLLREFHDAELWQTDHAFGPLGQAHILKPERGSTIIARAKTGKARCFTRLNPPEEMAVGGVEVAQCLRQAGCRRLGEPSETGQRFEFREAAGDIDSGDGFFTPRVGFLAGIERPVPKPARRAKPLVQQSNLSAIGVSANTVTSLYGRHTQSMKGPQRIVNIMPRDALRRAQYLKLATIAQARGVNPHP